MKQWVCLALLINLSATAFAQGKAKVTVSGVVVKPHSWSVSELQTTFAKEVSTISYTLKGTKHTATVIPLLSLVSQSAPKTDVTHKNHLLSFAAVVRGEDSYTIAFSLGELLVNQGNRAVWIALTRDGNAIIGDESPVFLIAQDDKKPSRWVHGVKEIVLVDLSRILDEWPAK